MSTFVAGSGQSAPVCAGMRVRTGLRAGSDVALQEVIDALQSWWMKQLSAAATPGAASTGAAPTGAQTGAVTTA